MFDPAYIDSIKPTLGGRLFYYLLPFRRRTVNENIHRVFSKLLSPEQQHKLALCFYSHIARSLKENLMMRFQSEESIKQRAEVIGHEKVIAAASLGKGVLILSGHFGNWEFAPIAGIMNFKEFQGRFYFIRKMIKAKWLERLLFRRYYQAGLNVIPKKNSLNQVCDALEQQNAVVFVMDQHASLDAKDGIVVDFFGSPAGTYRSLATIAQYMKTPVLPASSYRRADGTHVLEFHDPLEWESHTDRAEELYANTLAYNRALEKIVLAHPDQWLWMHKRWKVS